MTEYDRNRGQATVAGLDGIRTGWIAVVWGGPGTAPRIMAASSVAHAEAILPEDVLVVAVDVPLGLLEAAARGGRPCDAAARRHVGPRRSSVFSPPAWPALAARTHAEASAANLASGGSGAPGLSIQAWGIVPKIAEANAALRTSEWLRRRVIEVHPEVSYATMAGRHLAHGKLGAAGREERLDLLRAAGIPFDEEHFRTARGLGAARDDLLDAGAAAWTAWRKAVGRALCLPEDASGPDHLMRIWH